MKRPDRLIDGLEGDLFVSQGQSDEDALSSPTDVAVMRDASHVEMRGIVRFGCASGIAAKARSISAGRRAIVKRFVRAQVVVLVHKTIEATLLGTQGFGGRTSGAVFERSMHSFMSAVILGTAGSRTIDTNAELHPMSRQTRETCDAGTGERRAVIRVDSGGQSILSEDPLDALNGGYGAAIELAATQKQIPRAVIEQCQRITPGMIQGSKLTFEVDGPHCIGLADGDPRAASTRGSCASPSGSGQSLALKQIRNRRLGRIRSVRMLSPENLKCTSHNPI